MLNSPFRLVLYALSIVVAFGINIVLWTQFENIPPAMKVLFSLFTAGIVVYNTRKVLRDRGR